MEKRIALFVDAENLPSALASEIVRQAGQYGLLAQRRIYGDFSDGGLSDWLNEAPRHAFSVFQTIRGAAGKNGADIALVIDVMDRLHANDVDVFCLATCDSDFAQLAMRIRQDGKTVVGIGLKHAAATFRAACDVFNFLRSPVESATQTGNQPVAPMASRVLSSDLSQRAFVAAPQLDGGWVALTDVMKALKSCDPNFTLQSYGHSKLSKLLAVSGVELTADNRKARLKTRQLKKVIDNG